MHEILRDWRLTDFFIIKLDDCSRRLRSNRESSAHAIASDQGRAYREGERDERHASRKPPCVSCATATILWAISVDWRFHSV